MQKNPSSVEGGSSGSSGGWSKVPCVTKIIIFAVGAFLAGTLAVYFLA